MFTKDQLWKAIIEDFLIQILQIIAPKEAKKIDTTRAFEPMDKELDRIFPQPEGKDRRADKLIKVWLKNGKPSAVLTHFEAHGYVEENYEERMYTCSIRAKEYYGLPVAAFVIYTDANKGYKPSKFEQEVLGTRIVYEYTVYKVLEHTMEEYEAMDNPMAFVFQTALMAIKRNWNDDDLLKRKLYLYRKLLTKGYDRFTITKLTFFIQEYVQFKDKSYVRKFQEGIYHISQTVEPMGIMDLYAEVRNRESRQKMIERGLDKSQKRWELKKVIEAIAKSLDAKLSHNLIAQINEVKPAFVRTIERKIKEKKLKKLIIDLETARLPKDIEDLDLAIKTMLAEIFLKYRFAMTVVADAVGMDKNEVKKLKEKMKKPKPVVSNGQGHQSDNN